MYYLRFVCRLFSPLLFMQSGCTAFQLSQKKEKDPFPSPDRIAPRRTFSRGNSNVSGIMTDFFFLLLLPFAKSCNKSK